MGSPWGEETWFYQNPSLTKRSGSRRDRLLTNHRLPSFSSPSVNISDQPLQKPLQTTGLSSHEEFFTVPDSFTLIPQPTLLPKPGIPCISLLSIHILLASQNCFLILKWAKNSCFPGLLGDLNETKDMKATINGMHTCT